MSWKHDWVRSGFGLGATGTVECSLTTSRRKEEEPGIMYLLGSLLAVSDIVAS